MKYCENYQNVTQTHREQMLLEKWQLAPCGVTSNLQFVKKMQYRWSAIKQNTIKRGISVICFISLVLLTIFPWDLYFWGFMTFINSWKFRANIPSNIFFSHSFPPSLSGILLHVRLTPYSRNHGILNHSTHLSSSSWFLFLALLNILFATVYSNIYSSILPN